MNPLPDLASAASHLWWLPLVVLVPLGIVLLCAGLTAVFAKDPAQRADALKALQATLGVRPLAPARRRSGASDET